MNNEFEFEEQQKLCQLVKDLSDLGLHIDPNNKELTECYQRSWCSLVLLCGTGIITHEQFMKILKGKLCYERHTKT